MMHPKVVLVVSRSYWRCVSCRVHNRRTESIDQHLQSVHSHLDHPSSRSPVTSSQDACCISDGELDVTFPTKAILPLKALSVEIKNNQSLDKNYPTEILPVREPRRQLRGRQKRPSTRKGKPTKNSQKKNAVAPTNRLDARDLDEDTPSLDENIVLDEPAVTAREESSLKTTQNKAQAVAKKKAAPPQTEHRGDDGEPTGRRNMRTLSKIKATLKNQNKLSASDKSVVTKKGKRRAKRLPCKAEKGHEDSKTIGEKEENMDDDGPEIEKDHAFKGGECARLDRHDNEKSREIDKSKIATTCVPWLLDSGRKAGDKVTKKCRRALMPEEKQAVRELYGITMFNQAAGTQMQSSSIPGDNSRQYNTQAQTVNVVENCVSNQAFERKHQEEDTLSLHRNFLVNMCSQGTRDFMDNSRPHENLYSSYACSYNQQQYHHHRSLYSCQAPDFYSPLQSIPPQRVPDMRNYPSYPHATPAVVPSGDESYRHQVDIRGCSGPGGSVTTLTQAMPGPAACPPLSAPGPTPPSTTTTRYHMNTHSTLSPPQPTLPAAGCSTKSYPASLQQKPAAGPAPQDVPSGTVGENSGTHCSVCKQTFESVGEFEHHQRDVAGFDSVECKRCGSTFHGLNELNLHVFSLHETEKQAFCFTCDVDVTGMEMIEKHVHKHAYDCERLLVQMRFHDCRLCSEELSSSYSTLRTHYYQHHVAHVCRECFQYFTDLSAYKEHCSTHCDDLFLCSICGTKFEREEDFDSHAPCSKDIWAEDGKGDQCVKCGLWCPNRAVVEAHRKQHRSQEDVQAYRQGAKIGFPCSACEKVFKNKHACRRHVKMVHEGVSCYKHYCEYCGKGFLTKGHMRDHIALHHLKIKRYTCDYCSQQFVCAPTLRRHIRKEHTKHKPYECQHCGERFFEKTPLQRHLTQHTGLAPFMCEHCGKGFYTKHSFTNHASTHSSVKDYVCSGCQKGFTRKYNLQTHVKICKML
ncbi:hypothetical protein ACOMHN_039001 [Nucella lapillus]